VPWATTIKKQRPHRQQQARPQRKAPVRKVGIERIRNLKRTGTDHEGHATGKEHASQRHEKCRNAERLDDPSLERPKGHTHRQRRRHGRRSRPAITADERSNENSSEGHHCPHGKINASAKDHKGHANGNDAQKRPVLEEIEHHAGREEVFILPSSRRKQGQQHKGRSGKREEP
jgi:hypothetical protein